MRMRAAGLIVSMALMAAAPAALAQTDGLEAPRPVEATEAAAAAPAEVTAPAEEAATEEEATPAAVSEPVCRTIERSESRLRSRRERVCRSQAEWDAQDRRQGGGRSGAGAGND